MKIIAAVKNDEEFEYALNTSADTIFLLKTNIETIESRIQLAKNNNKKLYVHLDLAEGIGKDEYGIKYIKKLGLYGIISTRTNIIKLGQKHGLSTIQRFFIVDSQSVVSTIESAKQSKTDIIEIMPAACSKVISKIKKELNIKVVAGGLIVNKDDVISALADGAEAVSTSNKKLWEESI